jgi:hypothetical protein
VSYFGRHVGSANVQNTLIEEKPVQAVEGYEGRASRYF